MKGNISRESHRPDQDYSGVFQVQGGMVTDADLGEQAAIARQRVDDLGLDTAGCGVPEKGGAVQIVGGGLRLAEGVVYAEGVRGETHATGALSGPMSLYELQRDFPLAPTLPTTGELFVYADVWERTVTHLEDPLLSDPGLHGAETAMRTRTMTQLKFARVNQLVALGDASGPLPRIGGGVLSVTPVDPETIADDCDPCADVVTAGQTVSNGLFRIEVVHVFGDPQSPDRIVIAWSDENAAAVAPADVNSEDFSRAGAVYEFFSLASETHLGVHEVNGSVARSSFGASLAAGLAQPAAPEGGDWPFVRRWSGAAQIDFNNGSATRVGGGSGITVSGSRVSLTVDAFTAVIDFDNRPVVAGDYWLIEMRRFAETPVRVVQPTPLGIRHHFCPLFRISNGTIEPLTDEENRRLSFPTLADLPASHVAFDNGCSKLYDDAENVQEALDRLCDIEAADIAFDPSDCPRLFDNTDNLQDALINLCKVDFGTDRLLRLLHDWGVVCGVIPSRVANQPSTVRYSAGAILDRAGVLADVAADTVDLSKLFDTRFFHFENRDVFDKQLREGQVCLALAIGEAGRIETHLAPKDIAFGPEQPTLLSVFNECREQKPPFDPKDDFTTRPQAERDALDKVVYGAANPKLAGSQRLSSKEQQVARRYNDDLVKRFKTHVADDEQAQQLDQRIKQIDEEFNVDGASGQVRETRLLQREAAVYALVRETDAERLRRCLCDALLPRCPVLGKPPFLVPIACLEGVIDGDRIFLRDICVSCCRKQAMSWRMMQYYFAEIREQWGERLTGFCCPPEQDDGGVRPKPGGDFNLGAIDAQLTPQFFGAQADKGLRILTGRNPPSDYAIRPDIDDLGIEQAKTALGGNGVDVVQTIDVDDSNAIGKIRDATAGVMARDLVLDDGALAPGDKVALIVKDGVAIDYVKLETGGGKYIFDKPAAGGGKVSTDFGRDVEISVADLEARVKATEESVTRTDSEFQSLLAAQDRERAKQTAEAEKDLAELRAARSELGAELTVLRKDIEQAQTDLGKLNAEREAGAVELEASRVELNGTLSTVRREIEVAQADLARISEQQKTVVAEAQKERDAVVASIRRETPVAAVVEDQRFSAELARRGVTNLAGLAEMPDEQLKEAASSAGVNLNTARKLKRDADAKLNAPIR